MEERHTFTEWLNIIESRNQVAFVKPLLPAGAQGEWLQRQYYCKNFTAEDYKRCSEYMNEQRETKDDYIILKVEYNPMKGTCKFVDKVRLRPCR